MLKTKEWTLSCRRLMGLALVAGAVTLASFGAHATSLVEARVPAMAARSERVVLARVLGVRSERVETTRAQGVVVKGARVVTTTELEVVRTLKGSASPSTVTLTELGGTAGEGTQRITQTIHGMPTWRVGEEVVVFLERTDTGRLVVSSLSRGKYTVERRADGQVIASRAADDLFVIGRHRKPDRYFLGAPESDERMTLSQLEDLVAGRAPRPLSPKVLRGPRVLTLPTGGAQ